MHEFEQVREGSHKTNYANHDCHHKRDLNTRHNARQLFLLAVLFCRLIALRRHWDKVSAVLRLLRLLIQLSEREPALKDLVGSLLTLHLVE